MSHTRPLTKNGMDWGVIGSDFRVLEREFLPGSIPPTTLFHRDNEGTSTQSPQHPWPNWKSDRFCSQKPPDVERGATSPQSPAPSSLYFISPFPVPLSPPHALKNPDKIKLSKGFCIKKQLSSTSGGPKTPLSPPCT